MTDKSGGSSRRPRESALALIDEVCDRFEGAWKQGGEPQIEAYLEELPPAVSADSRRRVLMELVILDLEYRWMTAARREASRGEASGGEAAAEWFPLRPTLADYVARFPELGPVEALPEDLVFHERRVRRRWSGAAAGPAAAFAAGSAIEEFYGTERFFVERRIGAGGMGVVYQAYDRQQQQAVAIKTIRNVEPTAIYRLKREFRALSGIVHPNLVRLYELFTAGRWWFFTMELVEGVGFLEYVWSPQADYGVPLSAVEIERLDTSAKGVLPPPQALADTDLARGETQRDGAAGVPAWRRASRPGGGPPLSPAQLTRLRAAVRQIAEGVAALHAAGKLHRDIKPSNVLVTPAGRVVLLDFGLATDFRQQMLSTTTGGHIVGTIPYMSPEQAAAETLTPASDMYSIGVMLYEALTGQCPFLGQPLDVLAAKKEKDPPPPRSIAPEVPAELDQLCVALLQRDPTARPTVPDVLRWLGSAPIPAAAVPARRRPERGPERSHTERLNRALDATRQGRTSVVWVLGQPGSGKTKLVRWFLEDCRRREDTVVLSGRCYPHESVPFKGLDSLVDALSHYLVKLPDLEADALMPRDTWALCEVFPVLARVPAVEQSRRRGSESLEPDQLRAKAFDALRELLARLGDRKQLVLCIDDFHCSDRPSIQLLEHLLQPPDPPVLMLILSAPTDSPEAGPPVAMPDPAWAATGDLQVEHIRLKRSPAPTANPIRSGKANRERR